jgi:hypothetical protein
MFLEHGTVLILTRSKTETRLVHALRMMGLLSLAGREAVLVVQPGFPR